MIETLNSQSAQSLNGEGTNIRDLCADLIAKAREYTKAFEFRTESSPGAAEYWKNYRQRLATYDDALSKEEFDHAAVNLLKSLRSQHDSLCSFQAAFHHSIILHHVRDLMPQISSKIQPQLYKSEEIANEFANLAHIAEIQSNFPLYFAIAGWFVRTDHTLFCKLCLQIVNPADYKNEIMDPLRLHCSYCPILDSYAQWKLALEEYVYANSNPKSTSDNFALIQRQLAATGLETKVQEIAPQIEPNEEIPADQDDMELGTIQPNRTVESIHEAFNQSIEVLETPKLRDTDFEAEVQKESQKRKRQREETVEESPLAKRSYLPFPHNYLAEYNQPIGSVSPITNPSTLVVPIDNTFDASASNTLDNSMQYEYAAPASDIEQEVTNQTSNASFSSPESENNDEFAEQSGENEMLSPEEMDRLPLHEGGERELEDSEDAQSAEAESYNDDEATTDEEPVNEDAPYNEPQEFEDSHNDYLEERESAPIQANPNKTIQLDDDQSEESGVEAEEFPEDFEDEYEENNDLEEPEFGNYSDSNGNEDQQPAGDDSDSDIIVLD
ncbi:hypothetical protein M3Y97_00295000 [Aphelenchoides bicaudatus]|nr:hypothetical protein M3Y97_00295000 [Aphelenchoides bicaudatus]